MNVRYAENLWKCTLFVRVNVFYSKRETPGHVGGKSSFNEHFVYLSAAAARYLASLRIMTIGVDYLSVGGFHQDGVATHRALLEAGVWVIEGLDLTPGKSGLLHIVLSATAD